MSTFSFCCCDYRSELDGSAARKEDKFPAPFQAVLELQVVRAKRSSEDKSRAISWQNLPHPRASPLTCFSSHVEEEEVLKQFGEGGRERGGREGREGRREREGVRGREGGSHTRMMSRQKQ